MTNLTPEQRIDQLERLLRTLAGVTQDNSQAIADLAERTEENRQAILDNTLAISRLSENVRQLNEMFIESVGVMRTMQETITQMQGQVRGIQIENQRILRHLFGETENE